MGVKVGTQVLNTEIAPHWFLVSTKSRPALYVCNINPRGYIQVSVVTYFLTVSHRPQIANVFMCGAKECFPIENVVTLLLVSVLYLKTL